MAKKSSVSKQEAAQVARGPAPKPAAPKTPAPKTPAGNKPPAGNSSGGLSARQRAAIKGLGGLTESLGSLAGLVEKMGSGDSAGGLSGNRTDDSYVAEGRSGTSNTGKNYINGELVTPDEFQKFLYGDNKGSGADGKSATDLLLENERQEKRQSIYDTVASELTRLGLSSLIGPLKTLFESGISEGESLRLALSQTPEYQTRFSANAKRIAAGLSALSPAEYIQLEDQYQNVMRNYGLPASYYAKDPTGKQIGFEELLGGDVSATELEERLIAGQERVLKSNPEVLQAIKDFYGDSITNGNILAYALDPKNALKDIQRKVAAAEIGGAALAQKLATSAASAEELAGYGVTKLQAQQGFADVAQMAPRGSALSEIYNEAPYNQATATAEVFGTAGAAAATQKRKKLTALEQATFGGQSGLSQGALDRNSGAGAF
jgi:hypothetical protein